MLGTILFYRVYDGNIVEEVIQEFEGKNAYVHCAIAISSSQKVEALAEGITKSGMGRAADGMYTLPASVQKVLLDQAVTWLEAQVGQSYGYIDIADAILASFERGILLPDSHYDCSALASQFLVKCGIALPVSDVHTITPQELAGFLHVA